MLDIIEEINHIDINKSSGWISTCTNFNIFLWTINGELLTKKETGSSKITFVTTTYTKVWDENHLVITGHLNGSIKFWKFTYNNDDNTFIKLNLKLQFQKTENEITYLYITPDQLVLWAADSIGNLLKFEIPHEPTHHFVSFDLIENCFIFFLIL
jgi:hypothetical protein